MNEKIFIYLKSVFRSNQNITLTDLNNIKKALSFIYKKENYLNYIVKEYTQYRKKLLDDYLKKKYLSITNCMCLNKRKTYQNFSGDDDWYFIGIKI